MIDLHCHILPGLDDGSTSLAMSLEMARMASGDGITHICCTPHITPGIYDNEARAIRKGVADLARAMADAGIMVQLMAGADIHISPDIGDLLESKAAPTIAGSRYFLFEPPHHLRPPGLVSLAKDVMARGYIPVLTHPERLTWIEQHYDDIRILDEAGVAIQITAASITGGFGRRAQYWSHRMIDEGRVDLIASDAHDPRHRPPILSEARDEIVRRAGEETALDMTVRRPFAILTNRDLPPKARPEPATGGGKETESRNGGRILGRWLGRAG